MVGKPEDEGRSQKIDRGEVVKQDKPGRLDESRRYDRSLDGDATVQAPDPKPKRGKS